VDRRLSKGPQSPGTDSLAAAQDLGIRNIDTPTITRGEKSDHVVQIIVQERAIKEMSTVLNLYLVLVLVPVPVREVEAIGPWIASGSLERVNINRRKQIGRAASDPALALGPSQVGLMIARPGTGSFRRFTRTFQLRNCVVWQDPCSILARLIRDF
jgi:hypothetical protein